MKLLNRLYKALGAGLVVGLLTSFLFLWGAFETLELKTLDYRFLHYSDRLEPSDEIIIVTIDQNSIDYLKHRLDILWKWPRDVYAYVIKYLTLSGARAVLLDFDFSDPDINRAEFEEGETDYLLGEAMRISGNVISSSLFYKSPRGGEYAGDTTDYELLRRFSIGLKGREHVDLQENSSVVAPIPVIMEASRLVGATNVFTDSDGIIRRVSLFQKFDGDVYANSALALVIALRGTEELEITADHLMKVGQNAVRLNGSGEVYLNWYGPGGPESGTFRYLPIADVLISSLRVQDGVEPLIPQEEFRDKIVLIGSNAPSLYDLKPTPLSGIAPYPGVEIVATAINNLLDGNTLSRVGNSTVIILTIFFCVITALIVSFVKSVIRNVLLTITLMVAAYYLAVYAFYGNLFLSMVPLFSGIFFSFMVVTVINYLTEGREKRWVKKALSQYLSSSVMEEVVEHPEKLRLGGEKRELTILFSDIRGFTSISEKLEPEQLTVILNEYLTPMTDIVFRHKGTLDKYIGDAIMAFFGAPLHIDNHAEAACNTALDMIGELKDLRGRWTTKNLSPDIQNMRIGIGINTGLVSLGNMGSESRFDYTVMGDNVNLASRLEGSTKYYGVDIIVSESTHNLTSDRFLYRELDLIRVVGKQIPIRIFELIRKRDGSEDGLLMERIEKFHAGLVLYRDRKWDEAIHVFRNVFPDDYSDKPCKIYIERCEKLKHVPPPDGWDGVFERSEK